MAVSARAKRVWYEYIRRTYGVDPQIGQRVTVAGKSGTILRPIGDPQYLRVRFDDRPFAVPVHPTWEITYV